MDTSHSQDPKYVTGATVTKTKDMYNIIFFGTVDGTIIKYTYPNPENLLQKNERKFQPSLRNTIIIQKGKEVKQLAVIDREQPQLLALCNEKIHLVNGSGANMGLKEFNADVSMDAKILSFTICNSTNNVVFQSKQKPSVLYLYKFRQTSRLIKTFQLSEEPTSMYLFWPVLIVSMKKENRNGFYFIDCELECKKANSADGKVNVDEKESITNFGKARPQAAMVQHYKMSRTEQQKLDPEYILVVEKEGAATGYFVQYINRMPNTSAYSGIWSGELKFTGVPLALVVDEPFLISAQKVTPEVHSLLDKSAGSPLPISSSIGVCYDKQDIVLFSEKEIYLLVPQPIEDRTKSLIDGGHIEEALHGYLKASHFDNKVEIFTYAGHALFSGLKFEDAFNWYSKAGYNDYNLPVRLLRQYSGLSSNSTPVVEDLIKNSKLSQKEQLDTLDNAKKSLFEYLESFKEQHKGKTENELMKEIDESLVKLCAICRPEEFTKFLNTYKLEIPTEKAIDYLTKFQRWKALASLYKYNKNYKCALDIWRKLGTKEYMDSSSSTSKPAEDSVEVLRMDKDLELIKEYCPWIYQYSQKDFMKIWIREKSQESLPHGEVLSYLKTFDQFVVIDYLEYIVNTLNVRDKKYHTLLVELYCDRGIELIAKTPKGDSKTMEKVLELPRDDILRAIVEKRKNNLNTEADLLELRRKLVRLLQHSDYYDPEPILAKINDQDEFISEKTELYSRIGNYKKALEILFNDLGDTDRAEKYCLQYRSVILDFKEEYDEHTKAGLTVFSNPTGENPRFHALLDIYLQKNNIQLAVNLLTRYPDSFDPVHVLSVIPETVPLYMIKDFISNSIKQTMNRYNHALVTRNLESAALNREKMERVRIEKTEFKVDMDTTCALTGVPIISTSGRRLNFWRYPNGEIVAYDSKKGFDKSVSPVTNRNFKENPFTFPH